MCGGSSEDPGAAAAAQQTQLLEQQNQQHNIDVQTGANSITNAFSQFTPQYYSDYGTAYENAYNPQLTQQYGQAQDKMTAELAGNGQLGGSVGNQDMALLGQTYNNNQSDIANQAQDAENTLKSNVNNTETNLFNMNASAADPTSSAQQAQAAAGAIVAPQSYPALSDVFGNALGSVATTQKAAGNSLGATASTTPPTNFFAPVG